MERFFQDCVGLFTASEHPPQAVPSVVPVVTIAVLRSNGGYYATTAISASPKQFGQEEGLVFSRHRAIDASTEPLIEALRQDVLRAARQHDIAHIRHLGDVPQD